MFHRRSGASRHRRAVIKADRQTRRSEIQRAWNRRVAIRRFADERFDTQNDLIDSLIYYSQWAPASDLLDDRNDVSERLVLICLLRIVALKELPYDEYLKTFEWKQLAATAKKRYGGKCALDATHEAVDAHHRTYARRGREHPDDLIPLCRECHSKFHGKS